MKAEVFGLTMAFRKVAAETETEFLSQLCCNLYIKR